MRESDTLLLQHPALLELNLNCYESAVGFNRFRNGKRLQADDYSTRNTSFVEFGLSRSVVCGGADRSQLFDCVKGCRGGAQRCGNSSARARIPIAPERIALIEVFKKRSEELEKKFEARTHKSDWGMPYRLFLTQAVGKLPLVVYLHGSGGLGDDNEKQLGLGNIFGTRVWLLPENQKDFPCYVLASQTDPG